jgi:hypothetical protein
MKISCPHFSLIWTFCISSGRLIFNGVPSFGYFGEFVYLKGTPFLFEILFTQSILRYRYARNVVMSGKYSKLQFLKNKKKVIPDRVDKRMPQNSRIQAY